MRNFRIFFILLMNSVLATTMVWLGSPLSPYAKLKFMLPASVTLLPLTLFGIFLYGFSYWIFLTRNRRPLSQRELTWGTAPIAEDTTYAGWKPWQIRLHTKLSESSPDFTKAHPYDKEAADEMLERHSKEMEAVRLKLFGPPVGVWVKESIADKVKRLNASGIPCEIV